MSPARTRPGRPSRRGFRLSVSTTAAAVLMVVLGGWCLAAPAASAGQPVPYTDSRATGYVTLYDASGHVLTHGSIHDRPFAAAAVGSSPAPRGYGGAGRTATLAMIDPRQGSDPSTWDGDTATGSTSYSDPAHPTAYATSGDYALSDWLGEYTPNWDGLIQLRLLLGIPDNSTLITSYAASDIRVTGDTWTFVRAEGPDGHNAAAPPASAPKPAGLAAGLTAAVANESPHPAPVEVQGASGVAVKQSHPSTSPVAAAVVPASSAAPASPPTSSQPSASPTSVPTTHAADQAGAVPSPELSPVTTASVRSGSSSHVGRIVAILALLVLVAVGLGLIRRHRRSTGAGA